MVLLETGGINGTAKQQAPSWAGATPVGGEGCLPTSGLRRVLEAARCGR